MTGRALPRILGVGALLLAVVLAGLLVLIAPGADHPVASRPAPALVRAAPSTWRLELSDDFRHGLSKETWALYSGQPPRDPSAFFAPSHASVVDGVLNLDAYRDTRFDDRWVSAGLSSGPAIRQRYGKYLVRARMDAGKGIIGAILLWPAHGYAPPAVDLAQDVGDRTTRTDFTASTQPRGGREVVRSIDVNWAQWQTIGVEWTPKQLVFMLDGKAWASIRGREVPTTPMELDIQSQAAPCTHQALCPGSSTPSIVRLQVAWVRIYGYHPRDHRPRPRRG